MYPTIPKLYIWLHLGIISSLKVLPVYKMSCLCGIMFRDKYLDLHISIYTVHGSQSCHMDDACT